MTNQEKPYQVAVISSDLYLAMDTVADEVNSFIDWLGALLPELQPPQIAYLATTVLHLYVEHLKTDIEAIDAIKQSAQVIKNAGYPCSNNLS